MSFNGTEPVFNLSKIANFKSSSLSFLNVIVRIEPFSMVFFLSSGNSLNNFLFNSGND